jgi:hypothetical protein
LSTPISGYVHFRAHAILCAASDFYKASVIFIGEPKKYAEGD